MVQQFVGTKFERRIVADRFEVKADERIGEMLEARLHSARGATTRREKN